MWSFWNLQAGDYAQTNKFSCYSTPMPQPQYGHLSILQKRRSAVSLFKADCDMYCKGDFFTKSL